MRQKPNLSSWVSFMMLALFCMFQVASNAVAVAVNPSSIT
jgi:hypothetical protein